MRENDAKVYPTPNFEKYRNMYGANIAWGAWLDSFTWDKTNGTLITTVEEMKRIHIGIEKRNINHIPGLVVVSHVTGKEYAFRFLSLDDVSDKKTWIFAPYDDDCPVWHLYVKE
jgi:hypothetical protein